MMQKASVRATSQHPDWVLIWDPDVAGVSKAELGYGGTRLKIHHRHRALLRRSECAGSDAEQWLSDLHVLGRDKSSALRCRP